MQWSEMFPDGRWLFYEGDDPDGFADEMVGKHGFDPRTSRGPEGLIRYGQWGDVIDVGGDAFASYPFFCPADALDRIYGGRYPLGS